MGSRRAYHLSPADRPVHDQLHTLFNEGRIVEWCVVGHEAWWLMLDEGEWEIKTFDEVRSFLLGFDPDRCAWATKASKAISRSRLLDLLARLSKVAADVDPELAEEAQRALEAA